jgi:hypothetical protein
VQTKVLLSHVTTKIRNCEIRSSDLHGSCEPTTSLACTSSVFSSQEAIIPSSLVLFLFDKSGAHLFFFFHWKKSVLFNFGDETIYIFLNEENMWRGRRICSLLEQNKFGFLHGSIHLTTTHPTPLSAHSGIQPVIFVVLTSHISTMFSRINKIGQTVSFYLSLKSLEFSYLSYTNGMVFYWWMQKHRPMLWCFLYIVSP